MYLVGWPDFRTRSVSYLRGRIEAYETALHDIGQSSQHKPFLDWLYYRRPEFQFGAHWYGEALLQRGIVNTHDEAIAQILAWLDEYEAGSAPAPASANRERRTRGRGGRSRSRSPSRRR
jgi:hypothetical protein